METPDPGVLFTVVDALEVLYEGDDVALGQLSVQIHDDGTMSFGAGLRPGLDEAETAFFVEWAEGSARQLLESGDPQANGWFPSKRIDGNGWYMTGRVRELPNLD